MKTGRIGKKISRIIERAKGNRLIAFALRVAGELGDDSAGDMAGSIAYYSFLSLFPLLLGIIGTLGFFLPSGEVQEQIFDFISRYLPGSEDLVSRNIGAVIEFRGALEIFGIVGLLWTGSAIFGAVGRAINRAWGVRRYRPFYVRKVRDLLLALSSSFVLFLSMAAAAYSSFILALDSPALQFAAMIAGRVISFFLIFTGLLMLYKFMPNTRTQWRNVWPGAAIAAALFEVARTAFVVFLDNYASYDMVYGPIATVIVLLVWIYLSAFMLILGAEIASEFSKARTSGPGQTGGQAAETDRGRA